MRALSGGTRLVAVVALLVATLATVGVGTATGTASGDAGSLSGGDNFTCAVTSAGTVSCWGANNNGQLGDGTTTAQTTPQPVPGLTGIAEVGAGWNHACALSTTGGVWCWGLNGAGQVGIGSTVTPQTTPVAVTGLTSGVQAISVGSFHTCALTDGGGVKCWGDNPSGALGDGTTTDRSTPVDVVGLDSGVAAIAAGDALTCAVLDTGALQCWGNNAAGGVGDGTTTNRSTPTDVVGLGSGVASVSAAGTHPFGSRACAVTTGGAATCWGANNQGQLGDGTTTQRTSPVDVAGLSSGVATITLGSSQTCALTTSGGAKCWGQFAVGVGDNEVHLTPQDVVGLGSGVAEVNAGGFHSCARKDSGAVLCWGGNNAGQLGLGFLAGGNGLAPRDVSGSFHRPECPTIIPEEDTTFTSTDGYAAGSVLTFAADPGFALDGPAALTCQGDLTFDGVAPTASATSTIMIDPASGIRGGDIVDLTLSGFAPDTEVGWCQAVADEPVGTGNCSSISLGTTDGSGTLTTAIRIDRFIYAPGPARWADCGAETCLLGAAATGDLEGTQVAIELALIADPPPDPRGSITIDPFRQYGAGTPVTVTGSGFRPDATIDVYQCTTDPTTPADCATPLRRLTSDGSGSFVTSSGLVVSGSITPPGGSTTSCYEPSGDCVLAVAEAQDFTGTVVTVPLVDVGPVPTVNPGIGVVTEGDDGSPVLEISVTLTNDWHEPIEVPWSTLFSDSWDPVVRADPGVDYTATSGTVTFAPLETEQSVLVPIIPDTTPETSELLIVGFVQPPNANMNGFWGLGFGAILDDDAPPP